MPADGSSAGTRICENGSYFCKRDRNRAGTISIYTCKGRQTVRVADAKTCDPAEAELALARFVLTDLEAQKRDRSGITARDMLVQEILSIYFIARQKFQAGVIETLEKKIAVSAIANDTALHGALVAQLPRAREAARQEQNTLRSIMESVSKCWEGDGPKASGMDKTGQLDYVAAMRKIGYADSTIRVWLVRIFTAMNHCLEEKRLLAMPKRVRAEKWTIKEEEDADVVVYNLQELAALFNASAGTPRWWKYMNLSTHAPRPMTIIEATWLQMDLSDDDAPRWKLNPPGKRLTKKRRPRIPLCPSLAAELRAWPRDHTRVVTNGKGSAAKTHLLFKRIKMAAGITRGSAMTMRKTIRTWLAVNGVPEAIADWFVGHADEGSVTGAFYKAKLPEYMAAAVAALEKLYDALRPLVNRPFAGAGAAITEDQPTPGAHGEALWAGLRVNCVARNFITA